MQIVESNGSTATHSSQTGKANCFPANAPGTRHQDVNIGDKFIEGMVVELQSANYLSAGRRRGGAAEKLVEPVSATAGGLQRI